MRRLLLPALLSLALLTACTASSSDTASSAGDGGSSAGGDSSGSAAGGGSSGSAAGRGGAADEGGTTTGGAPGGALAVGIRLQAPADGRSVIRTAEVHLQVPEARAAADRAGAIARDAGGLVVAEEASDGQARLQLRIPPVRLDDALARLSRLGEEVSRQLGSEDVTEQVVDLDSRLATQRASVARVRALLGRADRLADVVTIEGELAKREAELESVLARRAALGAQVALSSVTVTVVEEGTTAAVGPTGFRTGLAAGWDAFTASARTLAAVIGALLPFLPLLLVGVAVRRRLRRATPAV